MNILTADRKAIDNAGCHGDVLGTFEVFWAEVGEWKDGVNPNEEGWYVGVPDCEGNDIHGPYLTSEEAKTVQEISFREGVPATFPGLVLLGAALRMCCWLLTTGIPILN